MPLDSGRDFGSEFLWDILSNELVEVGNLGRKAARIRHVIGNIFMRPQGLFRLAF